MNIKYTNYLKPGDIGLIYNKGSLLHKIICFFTGRKKKKAAHTWIYLHENRMLEATGEGIKIKKLKKYKERKFILYIGRYIDKFGKVGLSKDSQLKISEIAQKHDGRKYSFFQLIIMLFQQIFGIKKIKDFEKGKEVCSELVAKIYDNIGLDLFKNKEPHEVTPQDFLDCKQLKIKIFL